MGSLASNGFDAAAASIRPLRFQVVTSVTSQTWVSVNDALVFLSSDDPAVVRFVWASEESGFRHLYLVSAAVGGGMANGTEGDDDSVLEVESKDVVAHASFSFHPVVFFLFFRCKVCQGAGEDSADQRRVVRV